ncbi:MAG: DUF3097 family protein, partial [Saccharopolyspora sp.]|uniref:DUF3097 family protein n=1 Tax=Saccharopolyspora sp. TaxID=33915 RepID=UPI0025D8B393
MRSVNYGKDVLAGGRKRREVPQIPAEPGLVVEDPASGFCGAVIRADKREVLLEDRHGARRVFPMRPAAFLHEGKPATLVPAPSGPAEAAPARSASGSRRVEGLRARQARGSRIWVEGLHDAELVERVWGHDLRVEGVVVEPLHGVDDLPGLLAEFEPAALGIAQWPQVPRGQDWKQGVCDALGWGEPTEGWRRVLSGVSGFQDL